MELIARWLRPPVIGATSAIPDSIADHQDRNCGDRRS
jgi:hypothetical protein